MGSQESVAIAIVNDHAFLTLMKMGRPNLLSSQLHMMFTMCLHTRASESLR
jgi:hypothetical protein